MPVRSIKPSHVDCFYVRQREALGLGHAVLCAEKLVGDNPFAVILADDLLYGTPPVMTQMIEVFDHYHSSVIGVEEIPSSETKSYGIVDGKQWEQSIIKMSGIVEKRAPEVAPSNLGVVGTLRAHAADLRTPARAKAGRRRRTAVDGRDPVAARRRAGAGIQISRQALRLWQQARLSEGHRRVRTAAPGS
ncbi:hypothetical protein P3T22_005045 [Paraburkholderia sp. GAS348]